MISKEQARTFLQSKAIKNLRQQRLSKVNKLSGNARQLGRLILNDVSAVKDETLAVNTIYVQKLKKGNFSKSDYFPNPLTHAFEKETVLSISEAMALFLNYFEAYYLVYFDTLTGRT